MSIAAMTTSPGAGGGCRQQRRTASPWWRRAIIAAAAAGLGMGLVAYDIARNAAGVLMRRGAILTHDCTTGAGPCPDGKRCFRQFTIDYNCTTSDFSDVAWTAGIVACLPETTSQALQSATSDDPDFSCRLFRWVPSSTCCTTNADCVAATFTTPPLPTGADADGCCCCPCPGDCNGCGATRTLTIAGTGGAYDGGGAFYDGTFTMKACQAPKAVGEPCVDSLPNCQWFLLHGDGSITDEIAISCGDNGTWAVNFDGCIFKQERCCPSEECPVSGAYINTGGSCPGVTVSVS